MAGPESHDLGYRWVTGDAEVEATSREGLAAKLKAPAAKKGATEKVHKLRVFNRLSADGWEFIGHRTEKVDGAIWSLRRRVKEPAP